MSNIEKNLELVINSILSDYNKEFYGKNHENIEKLKKMFEKDQEYYIEYINNTIDEFNEISKIPFKIKDDKNRALLRYILNGLYKHFLIKYIEKYEGYNNCADKASYIVKMTLKSLIENKNKSLYDTYEGSEYIKKEQWYQQAFWSPKTIKDTNQAIELFWEWYMLK